VFLGLEIIKKFSQSFELLGMPQVLSNSGAFLSYPNPVQERIN